MGYTHYFRLRGKAPSKEQWEKILARVVDEVFEADKYEGILCEEYNKEDRPAVVNDQFITFNGKGDKGHETFYLSRLNQQDFDFCKTARKPYDYAVVDVLRIVKDEAPDWLELSSDGGPEVFRKPYAHYEC